MARYWWFLITTWFGTVTLQYISTGDHQTAAIINQLEARIPYNEHYAPPPTFGSNSDEQNNFIDEKEDLKDTTINVERRTKNEKDDAWVPNLIDKDKTYFYEIDEKQADSISFGKNTESEEEKKDNDNVNITSNHLVSGPFTKNKHESTAREVFKRSYDPFEKRDKSSVEHAWTWKRESTKDYMPKRVRFSPWGGKRSGQIFYKTGLKGSKIIFSANVPDIARYLANYPNIKLNLLPTFGKRHPIQFLSISRSQGGSTPNELPFHSNYVGVPRIFRPGSTYSDVVLKKDGKAKFKFSAWGGKRAAPLIGPIWTARGHRPENTDSYVLIRKIANVDKEFLDGS